MSRSGYMECDDFDHWAALRWRGVIASATRGKRGQAMFKELLTALDAMPNKRLIKDDLITETGDSCAIGALLMHRETPEARNMHEYNEAIAEELDVHMCIVQEVEWENDNGGWNLTPEQRWTHMRTWVAKQIKETA